MLTQTSSDHRRGSGGAGASGGKVSRENLLAEALYTFSGECSQDLPFRKGDIIEVLDCADTKWWRGRILNTSTDGLFPACLVKICSDQGVNIPNPSESTADRISRLRNLLAPTYSNSSIKKASKKGTSDSSIYDGNDDEFGSDDDIESMLLNAANNEIEYQRQQMDLGKPPPSTRINFLYEDHKHYSDRQNSSRPKQSNNTSTRRLERSESLVSESSYCDSNASSSRGHTLTSTLSSYRSGTPLVGPRAMPSSVRRRRRNRYGRIYAAGGQASSGGDSLRSDASTLKTADVYTSQVGKIEGMRTDTGCSDGPNINVAAVVRVKGRANGYSCNRPSPSLRPTASHDAEYLFNDHTANSDGGASRGGTSEDDCCEKEDSDIKLDAIRTPVSSSPSMRLKGVNDNASNAYISERSVPSSPLLSIVSSSPSLSLRSLSPGLDISADSSSEMPLYDSEDEELANLSRSLVGGGGGVLKSPPLMSLSGGSSMYSNTSSIQLARYETRASLKKEPNYADTKEAPKYHQQQQQQQPLVDTQVSASLESMSLSSVHSGSIDSSDELHSTVGSLPRLGLQASVSSRRYSTAGNYGPPASAGTAPDYTTHNNMTPQQYGGGNDVPAVSGGHMSRHSPAPYPHPPHPQSRPQSASSYIGPSRPNSVFSNYGTLGMNQLRSTSNMTPFPANIGSAPTPAPFSHHPSYSNGGSGAGSTFGGGSLPRNQPYLDVHGSQAATVFVQDLELSQTAPAPSDEGLMQNYVRKANLVVRQGRRVYQPDEAMWERVDKHISMIRSVSSQVNPEGLALRHVARPFQTDHEKVRAVFMWVAENIAFDWSKAVTHAEYLENEEPNEVLRRRMSRGPGYAKLIHAMLSALNIECITVEGYLRGPNDRFQGPILPQPNHTWNVVCVDGEFRGLDAACAAPGHPYNTSKTLDPWFFMVSPKELVFTHYPLLASHQFLDPVISLPVFWQLPYVRPSFFLHKVKLLNLHYPMIRLHDDQVEPLMLSLRDERLTVHAEIEIHDRVLDKNGRPRVISRQPLLAQCTNFKDVRMARVLVGLKAGDAYGVLKVYTGVRPPLRPDFHQAQQGQQRRNRGPAIMGGGGIGSGVKNFLANRRIASVEKLRAKGVDIHGHMDGAPTSDTYPLSCVIGIRHTGRPNGRPMIVLNSNIPDEFYVRKPIEQEFHLGDLVDFHIVPVDKTKHYRLQLRSPSGHSVQFIYHPNDQSYALRHTFKDRGPWTVVYHSDTEGWLPITVYKCV